MKNYFKNELKRALLSKPAIISFAITLSLLLASFMNYIGFDFNSFDTEIIKYALSEPHFDAIEIFLFAISGNIVIIFPLLASIIFSDSYLQEKESGFTKFIYTRMPIKKYVSIKIFVNSISSFLVAFISSTLILILSLIMFGVKSPDPYSFTSNLNGPFSALLKSSDSRVLYALIIILLFSMAYMAVSTLGLGISAWIKNRYLVLLFPFFYCIFCGTIVERFGINIFFDFHLARVISLHFNINKPFHAFIYPLLICIVGIALFYIGVVVKNEKDL